MHLRRSEKLLWRLSALVQAGRFQSIGKGVFLSPWASVLSPGNVSIGAGSRIGSFSRMEAVGAASSIRIGARAWVQRNVVISPQGGRITIGDHVSLQCYCVVWGPGDISIGNDVRIAPRVSIIAGNHVFDDPGTPIRKQGMEGRGISIEDDCWLGAHAVILDGVTVARGSVIAAGAVVTRSTEAGGIYAGVPARRIGARGQG